jgi:hypothetical protein
MFAMSAVAWTGLGILTLIISIAHGYASSSAGARGRRPSRC